MRKILFLYPTMIFGLVFGIGLRTDYPNIPKGIASQPIVANYVSLSTEITPIDTVRKMIEKINLDRALTDLRKLTGEEETCLDHGCYTIADRYTSSVGLQWAKDYVYEQLTNLGYSVEIQDWSNGSYSDQNLIIRKPGMVSLENEIYLIAHLDGVHSPAADDNASGVVSLLELARIIRSRPMKNTMVLLFSTGEEQGSFGVISYLDQLTAEELGAIKYVINIDMLGYDKNLDHVMELWSGDHSPSFALTQEMQGIIRAYQINLVPIFITGCG